MDYTVLLVQGSGNDQSRLTLAFVRAAPVRLRIAEDADEARAYLSGGESTPTAMPMPFPGSFCWISSSRRKPAWPPLRR